MTHALRTGPGFTGRIRHGEDYIDIAPDETYWFDTPEQAQAVAEAIRQAMSEES